MAYYYHNDKPLYFQHQYLNARDFVLPFTGYKEGGHVLEIGCGEGGVLKVYLDEGCTGVGVELSPSKYRNAVKFLDQDIQNGKLVLYDENIYHEKFIKKFEGAFDLIILKDVIEHIYDQPKLLSRMKSFLKPGGKIFFGFPPWQMPFGGHQQICRSRILNKLPYFHLLPYPLFKGLMKLFGENEKTIKAMVEIKDTGISIEKFEKYLKKTGYDVDKDRFFIFNPIYKYKFGIQPRDQLKLINHLPYIRDFVTTCAYYLVRSRE